MMNKILKIMLVLSLLISPAYAGEPMAAGTVLEEDSYVFTIEEAQNLLLRIEELEKKEDQLEEYKNLTFNLEEQIKLQKFTIELKDLQINEYNNLKVLTDDRLRKIEKREKAAKLERWGFLALGVGLTAGSILVADKIDDFAESN